jgi:hypothetical protein
MMTRCAAGQQNWKGDRSKYNGTYRCGTARVACGDRPGTDPRSVCVSLDGVRGTLWLPLCGPQERMTVRRSKTRRAWIASLRALGAISFNMTA